MLVGGGVGGGREEATKNNTSDPVTALELQVKESKRGRFKFREDNVSHLDLPHQRTAAGSFG